MTNFYGLMTICKQISWPDDAAGVDSKKLLFKNQASPENFIHDTIYYLTDSPHQIFYVHILNTSLVMPKIFYVSLSGLQLIRVVTNHTVPLKVILSGPCSIKSYDHL